MIKNFLCSAGQIFLHTGNLTPILLWSDFNSEFAQTAQWILEPEQTWGGKLPVCCLNNFKKACWEFSSGFIFLDNPLELMTHIHVKFVTKVLFLEKHINAKFVTKVLFLEKHINVKFVTKNFLPPPSYECLFSPYSTDWYVLIQSSSLFSLKNSSFVGFTFSIA